MVMPMVQEMFDAGLVQGEFPGRQQANFALFFQRNLSLRIETSQGVDFVVEQIDPKGHVAALGKMSTRFPRTAYSPCS